MSDELGLETVAEPVAAQHRFRHPQKTAPDWSPWQQVEANGKRPAWEIDSQGYEVEYRPLYTAPPHDAELVELLWQVRQYVRIEDDDELLNRIDAKLASLRKG